MREGFAPMLAAARALIAPMAHEVGGVRDFAFTVCPDGSVPRFFLARVGWSRARSEVGGGTSGHREGPLVVTEPVRNAADESAPLTVLHDGACPLCRREIGI